MIPVAHNLKRILELVFMAVVFSISFLVYSWILGEYRKTNFTNMVNLVVFIECYCKSSEFQLREFLRHLVECGWLFLF